MLILYTGQSFACGKEWTPENYGKYHTIEGPYSIDNIVKKNTYIPAGKTEPIIRKEFKKFKQLFEPTDKIYTVKLEFGYGTSNSYVLVRNNCVVGKHLASDKTHNKSFNIDRAK